MIETQNPAVELQQIVPIIRQKLARVSRELPSFSVSLVDEIVHVRELLCSLPLETDELALACRRLGNADRYLASGEIGAARYELALVENGLRWISAALSTTTSCFRVGVDSLQASQRSRAEAMEFTREIKYHHDRAKFEMVRTTRVLTDWSNRLGQ